MRPLYLAPDEDDDDAVKGPKYLIDHETRKAKAKVEGGANGDAASTS